MRMKGRWCVAPRSVAMLGLMACGSVAQAHVKWFSRDADCAMPPLSPLQVLGNGDVLWLGLIATLVMLEVALIDRLLCVRCPRMGHVLRRCDRWVAPRAATLLRWGVAAFFAVALCYFDGRAVYLTPELHTTAAWVAPLQGLIALSLLSRRTALLGAAGIVVLYGAAMGAYGWFHMLDYPIFLGVAACIALQALGRSAASGLAVLRVMTGVTLMWAAGEKWLYPWWSADVLDHELRAFRAGLSSGTFMAAAGWIEFCAAFALVFGRRSVQVAAGVLLVPFLAAIPVFGVLDAIGHAPILVVLVLLGCTRSRLPRAAMHPGAMMQALLCTCAAMATTGLYWLLQQAAYGRGVLGTDLAVASLMIAPLVMYLAGGPSWRWRGWREELVAGRLVQGIR